MDEVSLDATVVRKGKINAVTGLADFVPANQIVFATPLVNSIATAGSDESRAGGITIFDALPDAFLDRFVRRGESCFALDAVIENARSGYFLQLNTVQGVGDDILLNGRAIAGHEDRRIVIEKI